MKHKKILGFVVVLLIIVVVLLFNFTYMPMTTEEPAPHPDPAIALIMDLRNLRATAEIYLNENLDKPNASKPEIKLMARRLVSPARFTKIPNEFLITEANGKWWVGYNLAVSELFSEDRKTVSETLNNMASRTIYGSTDVSVPYNGEDVVYMLVR